MGAIWKVVPPRLNPLSWGPKPIENRSTLIPHNRATRKCPPSCKTMSRPRPTMATTKDIRVSVARVPTRRSGREETQHGAQQEGRRSLGARTDDVDAQLLRAALEDRL